MCYSRTAARVMHQGKQALPLDEQQRPLIPNAVCSRPTAVNLFDAANKLAEVVKQAKSGTSATASGVVSAVIETCEAMLKEDVHANKVKQITRMATHLMPEACQALTSFTCSALHKVAWCCPACTAHQALYAGMQGCPHSTPTSKSV